MNENNNCPLQSNIEISLIVSIAPDKDWGQLGIYPPLFGLIGYFKLGISSFCIGYPSESK